MGSTTHMEKKCMMGENYKIGENKTIDVGFISLSKDTLEDADTPRVQESREGTGDPPHPNNHTTLQSPSELVGRVPWGLSPYKNRAAPVNHDIYYF